MQAFGPKLTICACGPIGPTSGLDPGPFVGFLVVFRPWWPLGGTFFIFLFFFLLAQNNYNLSVTPLVSKFE